jgi:hypothetical protein
MILTLLDDTIIDQLKLMHFIKEENVLAIKQAIV